MLFNTTHKNDDALALTCDLVGRPFSLFNAIKLGGIGSKRMIVEKVSPNLNHLVNLTSDINYCSIELRPNGILVYVGKGLQNFTWAIPYRQLVIYKTEGLSIHAQGKFIKLKANKLLKENKNFFKKLTRLKVKSQSQFTFQYGGSI